LRFGQGGGVQILARRLILAWAIPIVRIIRTVGIVRIVHIHARETSAVIPISVPVDPFNPFKAMLNATDLPTSQYDDYSLTFN